MATEICSTEISFHVGRTLGILDATPRFDVDHSAVAIDDRPRAPASTVDQDRPHRTVGKCHAMRITCTDEVE